MPQQLYLSRSAVCIALQITNQMQLQAVRVQELPGANDAAIGDYVVVENAAMPRVMSQDTFRQAWARPDALLSPNHVAQLEAINEPAAQAIAYPPPDEKLPKPSPVERRPRRKRRA